MRIGIWICFGLMAGMCQLLAWSAVEAKVEGLAITVVTLTNLALPGQQATLVIKTEAGAMCLGNRYSELNPNDRGKLGLKNVDREGGATWSWPIEPKSTKGRWLLSLQCSTGEKKGRLSETFEIR